jgi:tetratricopeptide (TPR) repeat protein
VTRAGERVLREPVEPAPRRAPRKGVARAAASEPSPESRPALRVVRGERPASGKPTRARRTTTTRRAPAPAGTRARKRSRGPQAVRDEILRLGGRRGERLYDQVLKAADAFSEDRAKDAVRLLRPVRDAIPASPSVRELLGLSLYQAGSYRPAEEELEQYVALTGEVDQHPVLMDCARARKDYRTVGRLWAELADVSPSAALVAEGRIVQAGALADQGRLSDAIALLAKKAGGVKAPKDHHLRLWYALADLEERAGNLPRARALFQQVRQQDPQFADVAERLAALG